MATHAAIQYLDVSGRDGSRQIAYSSMSGGDPAMPGLVWLPGFKSEMNSTKASYLADWARTCKIGLTRFDYSGHGQSGGRFEDGTISRWRDDALSIVERATTGSQILIGSSMGGFIALLLTRTIMNSSPVSSRIKGMVLIAPAWDMISELMWPRLSIDAKAAIDRDGVWARPSAYGDGHYPITRRLIEDGLAAEHRLQASEFDPGCPVRIIHGMRDPDVPYQHSLALLDVLTGCDMRLMLIKDGEHRLSRPQDLAVLIGVIGELLSV